MQIWSDLTRKKFCKKQTEVDPIRSNKKDSNVKSEDFFGTRFLRIKRIKNNWITPNRAKKNLTANKC